MICRFSILTPMVLEYIPSADFFLKKVGNCSLAANSRGFHPQGNDFLHVSLFLVLYVDSFFLGASCEAIFPQQPLFVICISLDSFDYSISL